MNSVNGVTSGMLERRTAADSASIFGDEHGSVGEDFPDVIEVFFGSVEK